MKKFTCSFAFVIYIILIACTLCGSAEQSDSARLKNIIFMIGDGMGPNQVKAAHEKKGSNLNMENMPFTGTSSTNNVYGAVTDSAAGGTALATGTKTRNEYIGMDISQRPVQNIREYFVEKGKKTG